HSESSPNSPIGVPFSNFMNSLDMRFQKSISRSFSFLPVTIPLTTKRSGRPSRSASRNTQPHDQDVSQTSASSEVRSKVPSPRERKSEEPRESSFSRLQMIGRKSPYGAGGIGN